MASETPISAISNWICETLARRFFLLLATLLLLSSAESRVEAEKIHDEAVIFLAQEYHEAVQRTILTSDIENVVRSLKGQQVRISTDERTKFLLIESNVSAFCLPGGYCQRWLFRVEGNKVVWLVRGPSLAVQKSSSKKYQDIASYRENVVLVEGQWIRVLYGSDKPRLEKRLFEWNGKQYRQNELKETNDKKILQEKEIGATYLEVQLESVDVKRFLSAHPDITTEVNVPFEISASYPEPEAVNAFEVAESTTRAIRE